MVGHTLKFPEVAVCPKLCGFSNFRSLNQYLNFPISNATNNHNGDHMVDDNNNSLTLSISWVSSTGYFIILLTPHSLSQDWCYYYSPSMVQETEAPWVVVMCPASPGEREGSSLSGGCLTSLIECPLVCGIEHFINQLRTLHLLTRSSLNYRVF